MKKIKFEDCKTFEEYIQLITEHYRRRDLHINNNDTNSEIRSKDMDFGKHVAYEDVLNKWEYFKLKERK